MYIIIPAYEPDIRLIQVVQDITIKLLKPVLLSLMMGVAQGYNDYYDETALLERLSLPILSIKEREQLSRQPLLTFKKK